MEIKNYFAQDAQGNIMPSANCYLYLPGTTTLATGLVDGNGVPISNPFLASGMGQITFGAPNGVYDLRVSLGARDWTIKVQCADIVQAMDVMDSILGSHAENPAVRNNGQPLQPGDETWNSTDKQPYWWDGSSWIALNDPAKKLEYALSLNSGAEKVGHVRSKLMKALDTASDWHNAQMVNIWEFAWAITSKPDSLEPETWDWSPATEEAHAFSETMTYGCVIRYPKAKYPHSRSITVNYPHTGLDCEGSTFDFSSLTSGVAWNIVKTSAFPDSNFGTVATCLRGIRSIGPGWDSLVDTVKVSGNGVGPTPYFDGFYASDFRYTVTLAAGGYCCHFNMFEAYRCASSLYIPPGQTNLGENMSFVGGKIHGCRKIVDLGGLDSSIHYSQVSFDFNGKDGNIQWDIKGGFVSCSNCHWEFGHVNTPMTNLGVRTEGDQVGFYWNGGTILGHGSSMSIDYFANPVGSSSIVIENHRAIGIHANIAFSPSSSTGYVIHNPQELGNTSNVIGFGADQCLFDYSFEQASISDMVYVSNGMGTGTNRHTGQYVKLDNSPLAFFEGSKSLRVQKFPGSTSTPSTSFDIMVPARKGDRFNIRFKCLDKDSRGGGAMFATLRYGNYLGSDGNGIPMVSVLAPYITYEFTPTSEWGTFYPALNISGANAARCPSNCNYFVVRININNFNGGVIPSGDGGWYSLFFDLFEIYRW